MKGSKTMLEKKSKFREKCGRIGRHFVMYLILGVLLVCISQIYQYYHTAEKNDNEYEKIAEIAEEDPDQPKEDNDADGTHNDFAGYAELYAQNQDMVGWIQIEGTAINYPVMQTKENPTFYLHRNFYKEYSAYGVPFIQSNCVIGESDNLILYGHHMNNGSMFAALDQYKSRTFYEGHKQIRFNTLSEADTYEIVAAFKTTAMGNGFQYYQFVQASSKAEYDEYIRICKELAFYDTGVNANYGDKLITLSTCEYSLRNGRMVVVAKRIG